MSVLHYSFRDAKVQDVNFVTNLHRNLYDAATASDHYPISRGLILQFKYQILSFDKVEFLTGLFSNNFNADYTVKLLLSFPELWLDLTLEDWIKIISNTKRITPRALGINEGCFSDIKFLCRFLNIDGFQILSLTNIDIKAKKNIVNYFRMHAFILDPNIAKKSYLFDDVEENILDILKKYKSSFLKQNPSINAFEDKNVDEIILRIKKVWEVYKDY